MENFDILTEELEVLYEAKDTEEKKEEFLNKRSAGAKKIADSAHKKGGYSKLTEIHFNAKDKPYTFCKNNISKKNIDQLINNKIDQLVPKLQNIPNMSQEQFQKIMGELEVYGEVLIRLKKPNSVKF